MCKTSWDARRNWTKPARGFTLVELLIVISIIGVLIALLMPAVKSAQELGRRAQCLNNVKQMATACLSHEATHKFLPTGGWGWTWAGDPDRGFDKRQPGGWHFNILPYLDRADLHDMGSGSQGKWPVPAAVMAQAAKRAQTAVPVFICPTRHRFQVFPYTHSPPNNITCLSGVVARSDYAANGGDEEDGGNNNGDLMGGIGDYPSGDSTPDSTWAGYPGGANLATGPIYVRSQCTMAAIKDGESFTYLLGERFINADKYYTGDECDNDQEWDMGFDYDTNRWTYYPPMQDVSGVSGCAKIFGSAHESGFNMAFCDGSARPINYSINPLVHRQLGNRQDGLPTDLSLIDAGK